MVLAGIMGLDLLPVSNFPASCGEFSKPIPTKHHPNPQIPKRNPGLVLDLQYLFFLGCQFLGNPSDWGTSSCSQVANAPIVVEPLFIWPSQSSGRAILGMERAQPIASNVGNKDPGRPETTGRKLAMCIEPAIMGV